MVEYHDFLAGDGPSHGTPLKQGPGPLRGMSIKNEKGHTSGVALPGMGEASHP